jgi:SPP1 family predicted phage head-tail adaptor
VVTLMAISFIPSDFSRTVELGGPKSHRTGAGLNVSTFVPAYTLHYKQQKRTLTQQYLLVGTRLDNSLVIITRHDDRNVNQQQARIDGVVYDVADVSPDDSNNIVRYDYLTLVKITQGA